MDGAAVGDTSGRAVAAGDINGDGINDLIIGAPRVGDYVGSTYVVFGRASGSPTSPIPLSTLNGTNGFRLDSDNSYNYSGQTLASGDFNGDGIDDLLIGSPSSQLAGLERSGSSHVVFGRRTGFAAVISLSSLNGTTGFRLDGAAALDQSGASLSAGDINGDGVDDLIIGSVRTSGSSYVVFGRSSGNFGAVVSLSTLNGTTGFRIDGGSIHSDISAAGDINGDGVNDLVIGTNRASPNGLVDAGSSYLVFGRSVGGFAALVNLSALNGSSGFRLDGANARDGSGTAVSAAGDVNGDGIDDLIIGATYASPNALNGAGSSYVVFGRTSFAAIISLSTINGSNGFRLDGIAELDRSGESVAAAGDLNGDGVDDLIIGAWDADPNGVTSGQSYVVYGRRSGGFAASIGLSTLNGSTGFRLDGTAPSDRSGIAIAGAGDTNGDRIADIIIGASGASPNGVGRAGSSYVVFGSDRVFCDGFSGGGCP